MKINHVYYPEQAPGNQGRSMGGYQTTAEEAAAIHQKNIANGLQGLVDERNRLGGNEGHRKETMNGVACKRFQGKKSL